MKSIQIKAANGTDCIVFIDKITHLTNRGNGTFIHLVGKDGISTDYDLNTLMDLING